MNNVKNTDGKTFGEVMNSIADQWNKCTKNEKDAIVKNILQK